MNYSPSRRKTRCVGKEVLVLLWTKSFCILRASVHSSAMYSALPFSWVEPGIPIQVKAAPASISSSSSSSPSSHQPKSPAWQQVEAGCSSPFLVSVLILLYTEIWSGANISESAQPSPTTHQGGAHPLSSTLQTPLTLHFSRLQALALTKIAVFWSPLP